MLHAKSLLAPTLQASLSIVFHISKFEILFDVHGSVCYSIFRNMKRRLKC